MKTSASSKNPTTTPTTTFDSGHPEDDFVNDDDLEDFSNLDESAYKDDKYKEPEVDDKDIIVLKEVNFSEFVEKNQFVMVEFYALWVSDCVFLRRRGSQALYGVEEQVSVLNCAIIEVFLFEISSSGSVWLLRNPVD